MPVGVILLKASEIAVDIVTKLLTSPLGWVVIGVFFFLHTQGIYTIGEFVGDLGLVFWELTVKPLIDWIVTSVEQFIQNAINPL